MERNRPFISEMGTGAVRVVTMEDIATTLEGGSISIQPTDSTPGRLSPMFSPHALDDQAIVEMLFSSNLTYKEMAESLLLTEKEVAERVKRLGLSWVRKKNGLASRGQATLTHMMQKLLPGEKIISEYPIGERLRLDVYCPRYNLGAEFHGRQHFQYVQFFHQDIEGFKDHQERDDRKIELCEELGISLVVFRYDDLLTENVIFDRLLEAISNAPAPKEKERKSVVGTPYYEAMKHRQQEYRKQAYRKMKSEKSSTFRS